MYDVACVALLSGFGHRLVGILVSEPESDLPGVHADGELAADTLKARHCVTLQGKTSLRLTTLYFQNFCAVCVFDYLLSLSREVKANWEFWFLHTFTSAICQPGNTDLLLE